MRRERGEAIEQGSKIGIGIEEPPAGGIQNSSPAGRYHNPLNLLNPMNPLNLFTDNDST